MNNYYFSNCILYSRDHQLIFMKVRFETNQTLIKQFNDFYTH